MGVERERGGNQRLTDPRAGVRFRFNVSLHVQRGEALGAGGTGVSEEGCGVSRRSAWLRSPLCMQSP